MRMIMIRYVHATAHLYVQPWCVCVFGRTLGGVMSLAQHAEKKVIIFKFVKVFCSNFFF